MSSQPASAAIAKRHPTQADLVALLAELRPRQRALVQALIDGAETLTAAGKLAGYASLSTASETRRLPHVALALQAGYAVKADKARGVLDRIDSVVRRVAHSLENAPDLTDPIALTAVLDKLLSAQRVAMELAERGGGDREEQSALGEEQYYQRLNRWNSCIERRGFERACRYASIARKLGAGLTARR